MRSAYLAQTRNLISGQVSGRIDAVCDGGHVTDEPRTIVDLRVVLSSLGLKADEQSTVLDRISKDTCGLLIYGSRARGDYIAASDFDLLRLVSNASPTFKAGRVSVSSYTAEQLSSASHTLFGTHLIRDARILYDPIGDLAEILSLLKPADPNDLIQTVHRYSVVLDQPADEQIAYCSGLVRLTRYLLRTAVYAKAMNEGSPCFSVRELALRFNDPALATLLASDYAITGPPTKALLDELTARLTAIVGQPPCNEYGSLLALAIGMWETDRNVAALAVRAASEDEETLDYSDLPKVLL